MAKSSFCSKNQTLKLNLLTLQPKAAAITLYNLTANILVFAKKTKVSFQVSTLSLQHIHFKDQQTDEEQVSELFQPSALQQQADKEEELPPLSFDLRSSQLLPISLDSSIFYTWPKYPSDFTSSYNSAFNPLLEISFKIFKQVFSIMNKSKCLNKVKMLIFKKTFQI